MIQRLRRKAVLIPLAVATTSSLLYLWLPYRVGVVRLLLRMGGGRVFIGSEYSPLDGPGYVPAAQAGAYPDTTEILGIEGRGEAKAIPVQRLAWNLVANDVLGGEPIVITLCTITGAALAYQATCGGRVLHFSPITLARNNLVLQDNETHSRWQQFTGKALSGPLAGQKLIPIPLERTRFGLWRGSHPAGRVMQPLGTEKDHTTPHDFCPVMCHFAAEPFLLQDPKQEDPRLPRKQLIYGEVLPNGEALAWPTGEASAAADPRLLQCYWFAWVEFHPQSRLIENRIPKNQLAGRNLSGGTP